MVLGPGLPRGAVGQGGVVAFAVVEHLDVLGHGVACAGVGGEPVAVVHLVLQGCEPALRGGVVETLTG